MIETERLLIREFDPDADAAEMSAVYCDPEVMRFIPGGALDGLEAVHAELERHVQACRTRGFGFWAVVERATGAVVGEVGLGVFAQTGDLEIGYTFARAYWGRGYATEAATACLEAAFRQLSPPRLVAVVDAEHESSMRVARRLGMSKLDDVVVAGRPHVLFGCLAH